ncbi:hypothetical protein PLICRDRAFT_522347 [Plicaturopsis crispa FD-325 SS-3]|nr:hypothetical protein PLICRDRAFT_522347 [Plicaturopsis crispa FD-325 SS-3]
MCVYTLTRYTDAWPACPGSRQTSAIPATCFRYTITDYLRQSLPSLQTSSPLDDLQMRYAELRPGVCPGERQIFTFGTLTPSGLQIRLELSLPLPVCRNTYKSRIFGRLACRLVVLSQNYTHFIFLSREIRTGRSNLNASALYQLVTEMKISLQPLLILSLFKYNKVNLCTRQHTTQV